MPSPPEIPLGFCIGVDRNLSWMGGGQGHSWPLNGYFKPPGSPEGFWAENKEIWRYFCLKCIFWHLGRGWLLPSGFSAPWTPQLTTEILKNDAVERDNSGVL